MKIDDRLEITVVVATLDSHDNVADVYHDWRDVMQDIERHRFGFLVMDLTTGLIASKFADFYETISDAMNDYRRVSLINNLLEQSKNGLTIIQLSEMFNISENRVLKILAEFED